MAETKKVTRFSEKSIDRFIVISILLLTVILYANLFKNGFVNWDDNGYVYENSDIKQLTFQSISRFFSKSFIGNYHPLTMLIYAIEYHFFALQPLGYHIISLLLHLGSTVFLFCFGLNLTKNRITAIVMTVVFAVHPMHVESVAWVSEQKDMLYSLFFVLSMSLWLKYIREKKSKYYIVSIVFFLLSLLSKSAAVILPLVLIIIDYFDNQKINPKSLLNKAPFFALAILFGIIALHTQKVIGQENMQYLSYSTPDRFFMVFYSLVFYTLKFFFAFNGNLSALHPMPIKTNGCLPLEYYLSPLVIIAIVLLIYFISRKFKKSLISGMLLYLITLVLILNIIPVRSEAVVAERYTYIPYIGISLIAGEAYVYFCKNKTFLKPVLAGFYILLLLSFCVNTFLRIETWKDGNALWTDVIAKYPRSQVAYHNRAEFKYSRKDYYGAIEDYSKAIAIKPDYLNALINRSVVYGIEKKFEQAIEGYNKVIDIDSSLYQAYNNRGVARRELGDNLGALTDYNKAILKNPEYKDAYYNRSDIFFKMGDYGKAITDLTKLIEIDQNYSMAYYCRGLVYQKINSMTEACNDWETAKSMGINDAATRINEFCKKRNDIK